MAKACFIVDGVDFTHLVKVGGLKLKIYDLESEKAGRTALSGKMHRAIIRSGVRQLPVTLIDRIPDTVHRRFVKAIHKPTIQVTFLDAELGVITREFYGTEIDSSTWRNDGDEAVWSGTTFTLTEV